MVAAKNRLTLSALEHTASDILITASEGGSNYWARFDKRPIRSVPAEKTYPETVVSDDYVCEGVVLTDIEADQPTEFVVTVADIVKALRKIASGKVEVMRSVISASHMVLIGKADGAEFDATDADCVLQVACFGKIIYG